MLDLEVRHYNADHWVVGEIQATIDVRPGGEALQRRSLGRGRDTGHY